MSDQRHGVPSGKIPGMRQVGLSTVAALAIALVAISSSAPMIVYASAPALTIAFWRSTFAVAALAPAAATGRRRELRALVQTAEGRCTGLACVPAAPAL